MKRDRGLDQSLQKSLLDPFRFPPHVFPNLMRVIELARIEEPNAPVITIRVHGRVRCKWELALSENTPTRAHSRRVYS